MRIAIILLAVLTSTSAAEESLRLPWVFGDHMVLQRGRPVPVWGEAEPGEEVRVSFGPFAAEAKADEQGRWRVDLPAMNASEEGRTLRCKGRSNTVVCRDVLVGDVWLCAGQSNMDFPLSRAEGGDALTDAAEDWWPLVRLCNRTGWPGGGRRVLSPEELAAITPDRYYSGDWQPWTPETADAFSAVGCFFANHLLDRGGPPLGLIDVSVGGSSTEGWIPLARLREDPELAPLVEGWLDTHLSHPFIRERTLSQLERWVDAGRPDPRPRHFFEPGFLYEVAIEPLAPFAITGVLWYQGESNAHLPRLADRLFRTMVPAWRRAWANDELPFLFVQLPGLQRIDWPEFREVQAGWEELPRVHMAVTIDAGERGDVHPRDKKPVGERLAILAIVHVNGSRSQPASGPRLLEAIPDGERLVLRFDSHWGLSWGGGHGPIGFEVAGEDRRFHVARAEIDKASRDSTTPRVYLSTPQVSRPLWARYAWAPFPDWSLANDLGLPAAPFRTHDWRPIRVACIGDSITWGFGIDDRERLSYPALLQRVLGDGFEVRNFGHSGTCVVRSTKGGDWDRAYALNPEHLDALAFEPDVVICNLGINDIMAWAETGDELVDDYLALIDEYRRLPSEPQVLIWGPLCPLFPGQAYHGSPHESAIHEALAVVARRAQIATIDLHTPFVDRGEWFPDHLHPNEDGAAAIALLVREALASLELPFAPPPLR